MPASKNTWNKGLNSDLSKLKSQPDSYLDAKNIRVLTDFGSTSLAIENVKGNTFSFNLPTVEVTYKIDFTDYEGDVEFQIARVGDPYYSIYVLNVNNKTNEFITEELNFAVQNSSIVGKEYIKFYYNANYIVLYDFRPMSATFGSMVINTPSLGILSTRTNKILTHTILGWGYYNDTIVIISCDSNSSSTTPDDTEGFIWTAIYNNQSNTIISTDLDGDYLEPLTTLKYVGKLNLSRNYAISKHLKCRYENVETARVVWTDWYNNLRICNVLDPQVYATPEDLFSFLPQHFPQKPVVTAITNGGNLPIGKYQYFYQLYSNQGAKSSYSPISNLINLLPGDLTQFITPAAQAGTSSQKSVQVNMINLDTNYDNIRTGYVVYQIADFPEAFFFDERPVPENGTLTIVHNGNENDISVDSAEIANLNRPPEVFKTIDVVKNRLFAANAVTKYFDLTDDFDARVYRYNSSRVAKLYNTPNSYSNPSLVIDQLGDSITINGTNVGPIDYNTFLSIPETFDCINPFNNENNNVTANPLSNGNWEANSQYKYDYLGTTLGGTGPNISYEFCTVDQVAKIGGSWTQHSPYINPANNFVGQYNYEFSDTYSYPGGGGTSFDTMKSPYLDTLFTGYSRGEVYRFGIVFYDKYGYPSYPLWIGDVKFPFASDQNGDFGLTRLGNFDAEGNNVRVVQMGIRFTLDTQSPQFQAIKGRISGWSYVRLKRELFDRTRLGTGYIQPTYFNDVSTFAGLIPFYNEYSNPEQNRWVYDAARCIEAVQTFTSPNFLSKSVGSFATEDYIRFIGRTKVFGFTLADRVLYSQTITLPDFGVNSAYYIATGDIDYTYTDEPYTIASDWTAADKKFPLLSRTYAGYSSNTTVIPENTLTTDAYFPEFINMSSKLDADYNDRKFGEWGAEVELLSFESGNSHFNNVPHPDTHIVYKAGLFVDSMWLPFYFGSYERFLTKQYGGSDRASRYGNEYILTNHFMPYPFDTDVITTPQVRNDVYGGDTWVNYFDWQRSNVNYDEGSGWEPAPDAGNNIAVAVFFPAEVMYNTELNTIPQHASVRENTNTITQGNYQYNYALSQQNTTNVFISKGFNQSNIVEEPHTIYPSEPKLDGELLDSWRNLLLNNALTVNGNYGEINRVIQFKDKLLYYQNDAIGIAAVEERVLANEGDTTQTQLGTGVVLQRFDYISTETGCKHSFAVEATGGSVYHYDSFINKMFKFDLGENGMSPLTDIKGLSGFFRTAFTNSLLKTTDKILRAGSRVGIVSGFNSEYNTVYFTFFDQLNQIQYTISYNELLEAFESFYDFYPSLYLNMRKRFLSTKPDTTFSKAYIHNTGIRNTFYDVYYPSSIAFRVNENSDFVKTFDNLWVNSEVVLNNLQLAETVSTIAIKNDYQIVNEQNANFTQKIRTWRLQVPRDETNPLLNIKPRIADKYMDVTLKFNAGTLNPDKQFVLHDVITEYSTRSKISPN